MSNAYQFRDSAMKSDTAVEPRPVWSEDQYKAMNRRFFVAMCTAPDFRFAYPKLAESIQDQIMVKLGQKPPKRPARLIRARKVYRSPVGPFPQLEWPCPSLSGFVQRMEYHTPSGKITGHDILPRVSKHFGVTVLDLKSARRTREVTFPRQVALWLMRRRTTLSLPMMGKIVGNRDHSTVFHSIRKIDAYLEDLKARGASVPTWARDDFMEAAE